MRPGHLILRIALACLGILSLATVLDSELAHGAQPAKGNRTVLEKKEVRNYERPRRGGNRLAFCTADGQCGKHAADEFCRDSGFDGALTFQRDRMEGHSAQLRFLRIKCSRSRGSGVAKPAPAAELPGSALKSNTAAKTNRR